MKALNNDGPLAGEQTSTDVAREVISRTRIKQVVEGGAVVVRSSSC